MLDKIVSMVTFIDLDYIATKLKFEDYLGTKTEICRQGLKTEIYTLGTKTEIYKLRMKTEI